MMNCDVLLMIGTDFPYQQFFPKDATVVQIDVRGEQTEMAPRKLRMSTQGATRPKRARLHL
jgi:thiamine pyrophosphate-dependent acetolactate synthase large subunit-like protein